MNSNNSKNEQTGEFAGSVRHDIWLYDLSLLEAKRFNHGWDVTSSSFIIYLRQGIMTAVHDSHELTVEAPALLLVQQNHRFAIKTLSDDSKASVVTLSAELSQNIIEQIELYSYFKVCDFPFSVAIPDRHVAQCDAFLEHLTRQLSKINQPYFGVSAMYAILNFFFRVGYRFFNQDGEPDPDDLYAAQIAQDFIYLVSLHHTKERFLDFYARRLNITAKHLSRTVKRYTGMSAVEWIDMSLVIDAKMLLRTTDMSIKEIAEHLNFSSQSFFGKYFKKYVGMSPKEFRKK